MIHLRVGQNLPNFIGRTFDGQVVDLAEVVKDCYLVLYFYPQDDTPGCTIEGIDFSQLNKEFRKLNTMVVGLSRDSAVSHRRFCHKHNLKIPLLSDDDGSYGRKLGLLKETGTFWRTTLFVGRDGRVKHIWEQVSAAGHAREVLKKAKELTHGAQQKLQKLKTLGSKQRIYRKKSQRALFRSRARR